MITIFSHSYCIKHAEISDLVIANPINECERLLILVRLYASDKVHVGVVGHFVHESCDLFTNFETKELFVCFSSECLVEKGEFLG